MKSKIGRILSVLIFFCLGTGFGETLNQEKIHLLYSNGDFEQVISLIDGFTSRNKTFDRDDSIFIAKHLAVVYSANPATREKGKYYMLRLLELVPSAKLVDMYVSDEIDHIFDRVKETYQAREQSLGKSEGQPSKTALAPEKSDLSSPKGETMDRKPSHTGYWLVAGGAVVVLGGLTAFYFLDQKNQPSDKVYVVP